MYDYLQGTLATISDETITVDVGGVGYILHIASQLLSGQSGLAANATALNGEPLGSSNVELGDIIKIYVHHQQSETASTLYAFMLPAERTAFRYFISVSGVGPKTAARILCSAPLGMICADIAKGNLAMLGSVKGLGKRSAEKIIVDLRKKMEVLSADFSKEEIPAASSGDASLFSNALSALKGLGYRSTEVETVIHSLLSGENPPVTIEETLTRALRKMASVKKD